MSKSCEVKTLYGLKHHGEYGVALGTIPGYLFQTNTGEEVFLEAQNEFAQLNDYLCTLRELEESQESQSYVGRSADSIRDLAVTHIQSTATDEEYGNSEQIADFCLQEMSFSLKDSIRMLNAASGLLLIYFLLIRTLKTIVFSADLRSANIALDAFRLNGSLKNTKYSGPEKIGYEMQWKKYRSVIARADEYRKRKDESELRQYIRLLESNCGIEVASEVARNKNFQAQIEFVRKIRNCFSHGDWDNLESMLTQVSAKQAFYQIKWFLSKIEERYQGPVLRREL